MLLVHFLSLPYRTDYLLYQTWSLVRVVSALFLLLLRCTHIWELWVFERRCSLGDISKECHSDKKVWIWWYEVTPLKQEMQPSLAIIYSTPWSHKCGEVDPDQITLLRTTQVSARFETILKCCLWCEEAISHWLILTTLLTHNWNQVRETTSSQSMYKSAYKEHRKIQNSSEHTSYYTEPIEYKNPIVPSLPYLLWSPNSHINKPLKCR